MYCNFYLVSYTPPSLVFCIFNEFGMNIALGTNSANVQITEGDAHLLLGDTSVSVDDYDMSFPGEYERRGIFVETRTSHERALYIITIDSKTLIYLPTGTAADDLEILRDVNNKDLVIFPASESLWKTVETWEASVVVPYGSGAKTLMNKLAQTVEPVSSTNIKPSDLESESTRFILLG